MNPPFDRLGKGPKNVSVNFYNFVIVNWDARRLKTKAYILHHVKFHV